jgi:anti-sigma factor RsiW
MNNLPTATHDPDEEDLVAYLDGELTGEDILRIEARLSSDESYRLQLQQLQRAWDLLDELPRVEVSESFSQSTVSMVVLQASGEFPTAKPRFRAWRYVLTVAATFLAATVGFWATYLIYDLPNRELLADLPVIERLDAYQSAEDVEFLRLLAREGLFDEEVRDVP